MTVGRALGAFALNPRVALPDHASARLEEGLDHQTGHGANTSDLSSTSGWGVTRPRCAPRIPINEWCIESCYVTRHKQRLSTVVRLEPDSAPSLVPYRDSGWMKSELLADP